MICYYFDATQLRQAEQSLRDADRRKDEFLAMLAHELRNPLAAIRNAGQVLLRADGGDPTYRKAAKILNRQVKHMIRQVDDLLDVSRIGQGKIELRKERADLAAVVNHAVEASRPLIEGSGQQLTVALPPHPLYVYGDPVRLTQIADNLLSNACKFTGRGGRIELAVEEKDRQGVIRIRDTGIGIAAAELARIFEMFAQVDKRRDRPHGGLGLGLTLVRTLAEMHGGVVEARSAGVGRGSEFTVRLPLLLSPLPPRARRPSDGGPAAAASRRVLVADDNRDGAESLALLLKLMGHEVDIAYDGLEAVERAAAFRPEIILLDIGMPGLDGYEAARRIRAQRQTGLTLVALTGWGQEKYRRLSEEAGFDRHLVKPVDLAVLTELLANSGSG